MGTRATTLRNIRSLFSAIIYTQTPWNAGEETNGNRKGRKVYKIREIDR